MKPRSIALLALFLGPFGALANQLASYAFVYDAGAKADNWLLHVFTLLGAIIAAVGLLLSWRILKRRTETFEVDRFLGVMGVALNGFFLLVVLVGFGLPKLVLHPTD